MEVFIGTVYRKWQNEYVWVHYHWFCCMYRENTHLQERIDMKLHEEPQAVIFLHVIWRHMK